MAPAVLVGAYVVAAVRGRRWHGVIVNCCGLGGGEWLDGDPLIRHLVVVVVVFGDLDAVLEPARTKISRFSMDSAAICASARSTTIWWSSARCDARVR